MYVTACLCEPTKEARHGAAWRLLESSLQTNYHLDPSELEFSRNENGKPYLVSHPHIFFSLSHAEDCAVCAISEYPIGIDVEKIHPVSVRMKENVLSLPRNATDEEALLRWTALESYIKCIGGSGFKVTWTDIAPKIRGADCTIARCSDLLDERYIVTSCSLRKKPFQ